jgi:hypothetical protein
MTLNLSRTTGAPALQAAQAERRQPMWPWLLMPLVALTMYFLLKTAKDAHPAADAPHQLEAPVESVLSDDAGSH